MKNTSPSKLNPRKLRPLELIQLVNSTAIGQVIDERRLRLMRAAGGTRIGDGKNVDLLRFVSWLCQGRHFGQTANANANVNASANDDPGNRVLTTLVQLSNHYGVSVRVARDQWLSRDDFPGRSGKGNKPGYFPLAAINKWLLERESNRKHGNVSRAALVAAKESGIDVLKEPTAREQLTGVELQLAHIKLQREKGRYVDREIVRQAVRRQYAIAVQCVTPMADRIVEVLPADTPKDLRSDLYRQIEQMLKDFRETIAELLTSDFLKEDEPTP